MTVAFCADTDEIDESHQMDEFHLCERKKSKSTFPDFFSSSAL